MSDQPQTEFDYTAEYHRHANGDVIPGCAARCIDPDAGAEDVVVLTPAELRGHMAHAWDQGDDHGYGNGRDGVGDGINPYGEPFWYAALTEGPLGDPGPGSDGLSEARWFRRQADHHIGRANRAEQALAAARVTPPIKRSECDYHPHALDGSCISGYDDLSTPPAQGGVHRG